MSERSRHNEELTDFERDLAALAPRANFDPAMRARLADETEPYSAEHKVRPRATLVCPCCGHSATARRWAWPTATAVMTVVAASLAVMLSLQARADKLPVAPGATTGSSNVASGAMSKQNLPVSATADLPSNAEAPYMNQRTEKLLAAANFDWRRGATAGLPSSADSPGATAGSPSSADSHETPLEPRNQRETLLELLRETNAPRFGDTL